MPFHSHIPSPLVGYWKLDESSGTIAADSSGYGNDGTTYNSVAFESGYLGGSYKFTASAANQYVEIPHSPSLDLGNNDQYTIAFWFKVNSLTSQFQHFISKNQESTSTSGPFEVWLNTNGARATTVTITAEIKNSVLIWPNQQLVYSRAKTGFTGVWHHIALVRNGNSATFYVGKVARQTKSIAYNDASNTRSIFLGQRGNSAIWLDGNLDEVRIYNTALSTSEISAL